MPSYCPYCGTKIAYIDAKFCPDCGSSLIIETEQVAMTSPETNLDKTFPLPDDILNFVKALKGKSINFQTRLSLEQIASFYNHLFTEGGLSKNESFTNITEDSVSLAFNNVEDKDLVILQAVDLAYGANVDLRNVNIRTEKRLEEKYLESTEDVQDDDKGRKSSLGILITEKKSAEKEMDAPIKELTVEPTNITSKELFKEKTKQSEKYVVYVDDNFHYQDESERYKLGEFKSCEKAIEACKDIVDEFLERGYVKGISYKDLYGGYHFFGEDPFIISDDKKCRFSAWDYAKKRCRELCGEE